MTGDARDIYKGLAEFFARMETETAIPRSRQARMSEVLGAPYAMGSMSKRTCDIEPLEDRVVIELDKDPPDRIGSLYVPGNADKPTKGKVLAVGPGRYENGVLVPVGLEVGDTIVYEKHSGHVFRDTKGKEVLVVRVTNVIAKL